MKILIALLLLLALSGVAIAQDDTYTLPPPPTGDAQFRCDGGMNGGSHYMCLPGQVDLTASSKCSLTVYCGGNATTISGNGQKIGDTYTATVRVTFDGTNWQVQQ
jgi:hypothetical protein